MEEIFISYKRERRAAAEHLAEILRAHGFTVWFDYGLIAGHDWQPQLDAKLDAAKVVLVLWCARAAQSDAVKYEAARAFRRGTLLPSKIETCDLGADEKQHFVDLTKWDGAPRSFHLDALVETLEKRLARKANIDRDRLVGYDQAWRRFGSLSMAAQPLNESPALPKGSSLVEVGPDRTRRAFVPGKGKRDWFCDGDGLPEMVVVPCGTYMRGSNAYEIAKWNKRFATDFPDLSRRQAPANAEGPQMRVSIERPFAVARFAVTVKQFFAFTDDCDYTFVSDHGTWVFGQDMHIVIGTQGFQQADDHPIYGVSWIAARTYCAWLSEKTGYQYRLPSEAEWEYAARAGTFTSAWCDDGSLWDNESAKHYANCTSDRTVSVDRYSPNPWGLYQMLGNVDEWCEDRWHDDYSQARTDQFPQLEEMRCVVETDLKGSSTALPLTEEAGARVLRGGYWDSGAWYARSAARRSGQTGGGDPVAGFRVVREVVNP